MDESVQCLACRWTSEPPGSDESRSTPSRWSYVEFGLDGYPCRQIDIHDSEERRRYDLGTFGDDLGFLSHHTRDELLATGAIEISADEFERRWRRG